MKYFVRVISAFILLVYTLEGLFFAGLSGWGMIKSIPEVPNVGGGTIDGSPTPILDGIGKFFLILTIVFLLIVVLVNLGAVFLMMRNCIMGIKTDIFKYYSSFSLIALIYSAVNFVGAFVLLLVFINLPFVYSTEFYEKFVFVTVLANLFMGFWSLLDLLSSNQCVRDGL